MMPLILASSSPRRAELLATLGIAFEIIPSTVDESLFAADSPRDLAIVLAREKARSVAALHPDRVVIGADTLIAYQQRVLGKPRDADDAFRMLASLRSDTHDVITGIAVICVSRSFDTTLSDTASVTMRAYSDADIRAYIATGEPLDKAGAYAIQGVGASLIALFSGDIETIIGLPTALLKRALSPLITL